MRDECKHGSLRRACPLCEDAEEIAALRAQVAALTAERDEAKAEVEKLRGLKPELPPMPPDGAGLPRYGLRWNGPNLPLAVPMDDGYWTPWHLATARAEAAEAKAAQASAFEMGGTEAMHWSDTIRVERVRQRGGGFLWAVRCRGNVMDTTGEWDYEPIPSSRTDDFLARYRFPMLDAALEAARAAMGEW